MPHLTMLTLALCFSGLIPSSSAQPTMDDLITLKNYGAIIEHCGRVAVEKGEETIGMVLHFDVINFKKLVHNDCPNVSQSVKDWRNTTTAQQIKKMKADLAMPS